LETSENIVHITRWSKGYTAGAENRYTAQLMVAPGLHISVPTPLDRQHGTRESHNL